jgi:SAM-dependent methyltransferase
MTAGARAYSGRHAALYDIFYADKPYGAEASFVDRCIRRLGGAPAHSLLELACGTGSHALVFNRLGYDVTASDYTPEMLDAARAKAASSGQRIEFRVLDMRRLPAPSRPFDVAVCLFDSIGYVQTDAALADVFRGVHANLRKDGLFVFEFWHAPAMLKGFDPVRVRRFRADGATILRISETELDHGGSLAHVTYNIYELGDDSTYRHVHERQTNRFFTVPQMESWARHHGFVPLAFYAGFDEEAKITDGTWHVVTAWRKAA